MTDNATQRSTGSAGGWASLLCAMTGVAVPTGLWLVLEQRYRNNLAWGEGFGFYVFSALLGLLILFQVVSLLLARRSRPAPAAVAATWLARGLLVLTLSLPILAALAS